MANTKCKYCKNTKDIAKYSRCFSCRKKARKIGKKYRDKCVVNGKCPKCKSGELDTNYKTCQKCRDKEREYYPEKRRNSFESGKCIGCHKLDAMESQLGKPSQKCEICYIKQTARGNGFKTTDWVHLKEKLVNQNYRCYYTGEKLSLGDNASLDHRNPKSRFPNEIDSLNNVVWCSLDINKAKRDKTEEEFILMCNKVVNYCE